MSKKVIIAAVLFVAGLTVTLALLWNRTSSVKMEQTATAQFLVEANSLATQRTEPSPTLAATSTPLAPTSTPAPTMTSTPVVDALRMVTFDAVFGESSLFTFEMSGQQGDYYATARTKQGDLFQYNCQFHRSIANRLICAGGPLPLYSRLNLQLYRQGSGELLFSQEVVYDFAIHGEVIPSPTGVYCEVIPLTLEQKRSEYKESSCFFVTCWQSGKTLSQTGDTCLEKWPFLWDYDHPMRLP